MSNFKLKEMMVDLVKGKEQTKEMNGVEFRNKDGHWLPVMPSREMTKKYKPILSREQNKERPISEKEQQDVKEGLKENNGWKVSHNHYTGIPFYAQIMKDPKKFRDKKGIEFKIVSMSPEDYERAISDGFWLLYRDKVAKYKKQGYSDKKLKKLGYPLARNDMGDILRNRLKNDKIEEYEELITKKHSKSPLVSIEIGEDGSQLQEGHHRSEAMRRLGIKEIPVLVVWRIGFESQFDKYPILKEKLNMNKAIDILSNKLFKAKDGSLSMVDAKRIGKKLNVDFSKVDIKEFLMGLNVELEHKDITEGDEVLTARIALAHLNELPDYYSRLKVMEEGNSDHQDDAQITSNHKDVKSIIKEKLIDLAKAKSYPIGTVRTWGGKPYKKITSTRWVSEETSKERDEKGPVNWNDLMNGKISYAELVRRENEHKDKIHIAPAKKEKTSSDTIKKYLLDGKVDKKNIRKVDGGFEFISGDTKRRVIKKDDRALLETFYPERDDQSSGKWLTDKKFNWDFFYKDVYLNDK